MKNYILNFLIGICLFSVTSCDYLDLTPPDILTEEEVFSSENGVLSALTDIYVSLPMEDILFDSNGFNDRQNSCYWLNIDMLTGHALNRGSKEEDIVSSKGFNGNMGNSWWNYSIIRDINKFILNIKKATKIREDIRRAFEAEAYALRGWCYFAMAKRFGGVPLVDAVLEYNGPESIDKLKLPRDSEQETWDFILNDFDKSLSLGMPEITKDGRLSKYGVFMLKAQASLYAASIAKYNNIEWTDSKTGKTVCGIPSLLATDYYKIASQACDSIILSGRFELATKLNTSNKSDNFRQLFLKPKSHNETILARYFSYPDYPYQFDSYMKPWGRQNAPGNCPTIDLLEQFDYLDGRSGKENIPAIGKYSAGYDTREEFFRDRDARLLATIMVPGENFQNREVDVKYGEIDKNGKEQTGFRYRGKYGMGAETQTPSGMFRKKHIDDTKEHSKTIADSEQPYIVMRYAEVLLIAAEAKIEMDHAASATEYINQIRIRAGLKAVDIVTREEVRHQWICEMAFENKTFWNYRRWRIYDQIMGTPFRPRGLFPLFDTRTEKWTFKVMEIGRGTMLFEPRFYYNQISDDERAKNENLIQNFGY